MVYSTEKGRAVNDRSFKPIKVLFKKSSTYDEVLTTCTDAMWPDEIETKASFYISDNSGVCINFGDLTINDETIVWTLENYIHISSKYPSKTCLYSVKQESKV